MKTIEVVVNDKSVWLNLKLIAGLFDTTRNNITMYLNNILEHELDRNSVCKDFLHTAEDGKIIRLNITIWMLLFQLVLKLIKSNRI